MKHLGRCDWFLIASCAIFLGCFLYVFPQHIFVSDEISYINRVIQLLSFGDASLWIDAIDGHRIENILADYPLGTSCLLVPFYLVFGYAGFYIANIFYVLMSMFFIYKTIQGIDSNRRLLTVYALICVPLLFFSHLVMSELPSLLMISVACYLINKPNPSNKDYLLIGLFAGFSFWFRETNLIIFIIPCYHLITQNRLAIGPFIAGMCLGLIPRLLSAFMIYGNGFHMKDPGYTFSPAHLSNNLSLYAIALIFLFPMILYALIQVKTKKQKVINATIWLFIFIHLLYGYDGLKASGTKGILLTSRFLIPLIPLFIISLVQIQKKWMDRAIPFLPWLAMTFTIVTHLFFSVNNKSIAQFKAHIDSHNNERAIFFFDSSNPELLELLTPIKANSTLSISDFNAYQNSGIALNKEFSYYIINQRRVDTDDRREKQFKTDSLLVNHFPVNQLNLVEKVNGPYQDLELYKLENK